MLELGTGGTLPRIKAGGSFCLQMPRHQDALLMISWQNWLLSLTTYLQLSPTQGLQVPECWPKFQTSEFCHVSELGQSDTCCFTRFKIQMFPQLSEKKVA